MKLSFRILVTRCRTDEEFQRTLLFLDQYRDCIDEISLFTEYWHHGYYPLDRFAELCEVLKDRVAHLKREGYSSVGINMLNTIGHTDEAWDILPKLPFQPIVGHDGVVSLSSFCPNDPDAKEYIRKKYTMIARARPDFIWVDDDTRLFHHPNVKFACFCPTCIDLFNVKYELTGGREELAKKLNATGGKKLRAAWVQQNVETIERLMQLIEQSVHAVDGSIVLGLMTTGKEMSTYNGDRYDLWMEGLKATKGRPGSGFFNDVMPIQMLRKAIGIVGRQVAAYPACVTDIQYELENFPFQKLGKSLRMFTAECTASLFNGANGIAFDALKQELGSLDDYHDIMKRIEINRPYWKTIVSKMTDLPLAGLYPAFSSTIAHEMDVKNGDWFKLLETENFTNEYGLNELGIPYTFQENQSSGTVLSGSMALGFSVDELKCILGKGVLLDGQALEVLWQRGLGELCGVEIIGTYSNGVLEQFTEDPLNGNNHKEQRDGRLSFWGDKAFVLRPTNDRVRSLSGLIDYNGKELGSTFTVFENELGGRVAVHGYMPWTNLASSAKRAQLVAVCDWISKDRLPVIIKSTLKIVPFVRASNSRAVIGLLNTSFDETGEFEIELRTPATCLYEISAVEPRMHIEESRIRREMDKTFVTLRSIEPWTFQILEAE